MFVLFDALFTNFSVKITNIFLKKWKYWIFIVFCQKIPYAAAVKYQYAAIYSYIHNYIHTVCTFL